MIKLYKLAILIQFRIKWYKCIDDILDQYIENLLN